MGYTSSSLLISHLKQAEGFMSKAYKCPGGVWTIGYGTTRINGKAVTPGMTCTREQAEGWLKADLKAFERGVNSASGIKNQGQFDACVDFAYNCGLGRFNSAIKPLLNQGPETVCAKFRKYVYAKGKKLKGLVTRREWECARFKGLPVNGNYSEPVNQSPIDDSEEPQSYYPDAATAEANGEFSQTYGSGDYAITMVDELGDDFQPSYQVVEDPDANRLTPKATGNNEETTKGEGKLPPTLHKEMDNAIENDELTASAKPEDLVSNDGEDNTSQNAITNGQSDGASAGDLGGAGASSTGDMFQSYGNEDYNVGGSRDEFADGGFNYSSDNG